MELVKSSLNIGVDPNAKEKDDVGVDCRNNRNYYIFACMFSITGLLCCGPVIKVTEKWWISCWNMGLKLMLKM